MTRFSYAKGFSGGVSFNLVFICDIARENIAMEVDLKGNRILGRCPLVRSLKVRLGMGVGK